MSEVKDLKEEIEFMRIGLERALCFQLYGPAAQAQSIIDRLEKLLEEERKKEEA